MSEGAKHYRLGKVGIGNASKVGGTLGCVLGFLGGLGYAGYMMSTGAVAPGDTGLLLAMPVILLGVIGVDCMIVAAICAWVFNLTTRFSGGLIVQLEEIADPAAAA